MEACRVHCSAYFAHCLWNVFILLNLVQIIYIVVGYFILWMDWGTFLKDFSDFTCHISLLIHSGLILYIVKDRNPFICLLTWLISCAASLLKDPYFPTGWKHQFYHILNMWRYLSICPIVFCGCFQTFPYLLVYDTVLKHGLDPGKESPWRLLHTHPELFS